MSVRKTREGGRDESMNGKKEKRKGMRGRERERGKESRAMGTE